MVLARRRGWLKNVGHEDALVREIASIPLALGAPLGGLHAGNGARHHFRLGLIHAGGGTARGPFVLNDANVIQFVPTDSPVLTSLLNDWLPRDNSGSRPLVR